MDDTGEQTTWGISVVCQWFSYTCWKRMSNSFLLNSCHDKLLLISILRGRRNRLRSLPVKTTLIPVSHTWPLLLGSEGSGVRGVANSTFGLVRFTFLVSSVSDVPSPIPRESTTVQRFTQCFVLCFIFDHKHSFVLIVLPEKDFTAKRNTRIYYPLNLKDEPVMDI